MFRFLVPAFIVFTLLFSCSQASDSALSLKADSAVNASGTATMIQLVYANTTHNGTYNGMGWPSYSIEAKVYNAAYTKKVSVYYKKDDGTWADLALSYLRNADTGYEIWGRSADYSTLGEFVLKYEVNGQTYWDNNSGKNYKMGICDGVLLGKGYNVLSFSGRFYYNQTSFVGDISVRNLAYNKVVKVVYTTDNWATSKTTTATFVPSYSVGYSNSVVSPNVHGVERWSYGMDIGNASTVEYAISYQVNGQTYWDNNYGKNYKATR